MARLYGECCSLYLYYICRMRLRVKPAKTQIVSLLEMGFRKIGEKSCKKPAFLLRKPTALFIKMG